MEREGRKNVLPVRVVISTEHKYIEDMRGALVRAKAAVAVETNKCSKEKIPRISKHGPTEQRVGVFNNGLSNTSNLKQEGRKL
jgi:hypothetical protein